MKSVVCAVGEAQALCSSLVSICSLFLRFTLGSIGSFMAHKYLETDRHEGIIYEIIEKSTGTVLYVGQHNRLDVDARKEQHVQEDTNNHGIIMAMRLIGQ